MKAIIVAFSDNHAIGNNGDIPWMGQMPADMKRVRELTENNAIIMGLNTFRSIGRPLPRRENIVLIDNEDIRAEISEKFPSVIFANSLEQAFAQVSDDKIAFIFGGAYVYRETMARAAELEIDVIFATEIHGEFEGDTFFPEISPKSWREVEREDFAKDDTNQFPYSFVKYERVL